MKRYNLNEQIKRVLEIMKIDNKLPINEQIFGKLVDSIIKKLGAKFGNEFYSALKNVLKKDIHLATEVELRTAIKSAEMAAFRKTIAKQIVKEKKNVIDEILGRYPNLSTNTADQDAASAEILNALDLDKSFLSDVKTEYKAIKGTPTPHVIPPPATINLEEIITTNSIPQQYGSLITKDIKDLINNKNIKLGDLENISDINLSKIQNIQQLKNNKIASSALDEANKHQKKINLIDVEIKNNEKIITENGIELAKIQKLGAQQDLNVKAAEAKAAIMAAKARKAELMVARFKLLKLFFWPIIFILFLVYGYIKVKSFIDGLSGKKTKTPTKQPVQQQPVQQQPVQQQPVQQPKVDTVANREKLEW